MCVAITKEQVVAGYVNRHEDEAHFNFEDVLGYVSTLWNSGCGPVRLNFTDDELRNYLNQCNDVCLKVTDSGYVIQKNLLDESMTEEECLFFNGNTTLAKSFDLFCKLGVDLLTPPNLLNAMGFSFIHTGK